MNRDLIKIESDGYVLEEIIPNKELIFYKKDNSKVDIDMFRLLYFKYVTQRILLKDNFSDNDLIFTYQDNYVKINIKSHTKNKKIFQITYTINKNYHNLLVWS